MNLQPYRTPPRWWSPRLSPFWLKVWRPLRRLRVYRQHGLVDVEVRGLEHLQGPVEAGLGVLITPNHATHADPYVLVEAAEQLGNPFFFMAAWQVFAMTHRLGRRVLRQHGCFSINREGHDLRALRRAVQILQSAEHPLVIFPEGEVFHLNDCVMPFRRGAGTAALLAARRSGRPVACVPCALKFQYITDPVEKLARLMNQLENRLSWPTRPEMPLVRRLHRFAEGILNLKELQYLGGARSGELHERMTELISVILGRLEDRYGIAAFERTVPERVKLLRQRVIARLENSGRRGDPQRRQQQQDLDDLFFVMQLYSYPVDYVTEQPTLERLAETFDKLEEDVLGVRTARRRGLRRAIVSFGEPVLAEPHQRPKTNAADLTWQLQTRVQSLLDELNDSDLAAQVEVPRRPAGRAPAGSGALQVSGSAA